MDNITLIESGHASAATATSTASPGPPNVRVDDDSSIINATNDAEPRAQFQSEMSHENITFRLWKPVITISETELRRNPYYYR